jgi:hypothetical protein
VKLVAEGEFIGSPFTILAQSEQTLSSTQIRCTLTVPFTAPLGTYTLAVQNPGTTTWVSRTGAFRVYIVPKPESVSPSSIFSTGSVGFTGYVYGSNFMPGAQVKFRYEDVDYAGPGDEPIRVEYAATSEYTENSGRIWYTATIPRTAPEGGPYLFYVQNPGQPGWTEGPEMEAFLKEVGPVTVTSISPTTAYRGTTTTVSVAGTGFTIGSEVSLTGGSTTIYGSGETVNAAGTQITCTVAVPATAYVGSYTLTVKPRYHAQYPRRTRSRWALRPQSQASRRPPCLPPAAHIRPMSTVRTSYPGRRSA